MDKFVMLTRRSWWVSVVIVIFIALLVPYAAFTLHQTLLESSTAVLLLPVVPA